MSEKVLQPLSPNDHSTQLLSGGELSIENVNVTASNTGHVNINSLSDYTAFDHSVFDKYLRFPTILYEGTITPTATVGTVLYETLVAPTILTSTRVSRLANIATNFLQWNGDIVIRVIFTKAIFMQTKIIAAFIPTATKADGAKFNNSDLYGAQYHAIMNPDNDNELSFVIPFISGKNWHDIQESTGLFQIRLFQPLVSSQPTGTTNTSIPFTITVASSTDSRHKPFSFRYLIAPQTVNPIINAEREADFARQISPQVQDTNNSFSQYSILEPQATTGPGATKRFRSMAIVPTDVVVRASDSARAVTYPTINIAQATNGYLSTYPTGVVSGSQITPLTADVKFPSSRQTYATYNSDQLIDVNIPTDPITFDLLSLLTPLNANYRYVNTTVISGAVGRFTSAQFFNTPAQSPGTWIAIGFDANLKHFTMGITSPQMLIDLTAVNGLTISNFATVVNFGGSFSEAIQCTGGSFIFQYNPTLAMFQYYFEYTIVTTQTTSANLTFANGTYPVLKFLPGTNAWVTNQQNNTLKRVAEINRVASLESLARGPGQTYIIAYSCCSTAQLATQIAAGNLSNLWLEGNTTLSAALDRRALSQFDNRLNFVRIYMAIRKGVNLIAKISAYIDGMFTYVDNFIPPATDPNTFNPRINETAILIPLDTTDNVSFELDENNTPFTRYFDSSIVSVTLGPIETRKITNLPVEHNQVQSLINNQNL